ncbi:hypothetical protein BH10PSE18_BH10PSE18_32010 [soil metagenome]
MRVRRPAVWLSCVLGLAPLGAGAVAPDADGWSGVYRLEWFKGSVADRRAGGPVQIVIARTPDADADQTMERDRADLRRWALTEAGSAERSPPLRPFVARDYEGWGWTATHAAGGIECIDGERLFVCRAKPGATVAFGPVGSKQETLVAQTGLFGIVLHEGAFELKKLD